MSLLAELRDRILPGLLPTGPVCDGVQAICDGIVNLYVVQAPKGLICFDAGWSDGRVRQGFRQLGLDTRDVAAVFATHLDWDHVRCAGLYENARLFAGAAELASRKPDGRAWTGLADGETVTVAGLTARAIATPGHTAGSVSYLAGEGLLFTGDALRLRNGTALPFFSFFNRDATHIEDSLRKLAALPGLRRVLTAHSGASDSPDTALLAWRTGGAQ